MLTLKDRIKISIAGSSAKIRQLALLARMGTQRINNSNNKSIQIAVGIHQVMVT